MRLTLALLLALPLLWATPARAASAAIPPGQALPSEAQCAQQVQPRAEVVPANSGPNHVAANHQPALTMERDGYDARADQLAARVNGNFTGTTDELAQFYACKWGWDADVLRAVMQQESSWQQAEVGDGGESFGIAQVRVKYYPGTEGYAATSTPFNLDAYLMFQRVCFEGLTVWLNDSHPGQYKAGDVWGCVGWWYRGDSWHDGDAAGYIASVQAHLAARDWPQAQPVTPGSPSPSATPRPTPRPSPIPSPITVSSPSPSPGDAPVVLTCPGGVVVAALGSDRYSVACK